jgi:DNA repair exonuclease SbcCD ATPase subunit
MKLQELIITQLPGFGEGLRVEGLAPGFTLVTGPNASGKSSLVRALRHLVSPGSESANGAITLEARFSSGDDGLTVSRSGEQVVWQRNGQPTDAPELPAGDFLRCYWLSMNDLLQAGDTEASILARLQRELAGGFDLDSLRQDPLFRVKPQQGQREARALRDKEQALAKCQRDYAHLDQQRHRLAELDERIEAARAARTGVTRTEQALEWLAARQRRRGADEELAAFPAAVAHLNGQERERLDELEAQRDRLVQQIRDNERQQDDERQKRRDSGLEERAPEAADLAGCEQHLAEADRRIADRASLRERLDEARAREANAAAALQPPEGRTPEPTPEAVNQAGEMAESLRRVRLRMQELEARLENTEGDQEDPESIRTRINALRRWLRQLEPARRYGLLAGSAVALGASIAGVYMGLFYGLQLHWAPALVAVVAAGWSTVQSLQLVLRARQARERAEEAGVTLSEWQLESVTSHLEELETELAAAVYQQEQAQQARAHASEIESLEKQQSQLEGNRQALAEAVGFDPALSGEGAARFLKLAADLDQARSDRRQLEARLASLDSQIEGELEPVRSLLARQHLAPVDDTATGLRAAFEDLKQRSETVTEAEQALSRLQARREELEADHHQQQEAIKALYHSLDLPEDDRVALASLCDQLPRYRELVTTREAERRAEKARAEGLEEDPDLVALVEASDQAGLEERLATLREEAAYYDQWLEERSQLATKLDQAGRDRALEQARFERDRAREALQNVFDDTMVAEAGQFLLGQVDAAHRTEREPAVLADTRDRFARFTHHRYDLWMDERGQIRVRDRLQERDQDLIELSTGTHMQLLMALRLAWVRALEQGSEPLPIFLDEVLTTSDPERFRAIAASLRTLVQDEGRQVIYLSAEPLDRARWEEAFGAPVTHIDLEVLRRGAEVPETGDYRLPEQAALPFPSNEAPDEWAARIGVPPVQPGRGAGAIHLFHLLRDDLSLAHHLIQDWRVDRLGRLETLLQQPAGASAVPAPAYAQTLNARIRVARVWVDVWQRGRGRPVDRNVLEASGAVTPKFIDPVAELAERLDGDPGALLASLENGGVARFQTNKLRELEAYLENEGYLDTRDPLDAAQRERTVLLEAGHEADAAAIRQWVAWLEAGLA